MKERKTLLSAVGSFFAFALLALVMFVPGVKADAAALTVKEINYEDSTITIHSDQKDTILYFSDKNKKKWETATDPFDTEGNCKMDISWVSTTKDYMITFKGDVSTDIIETTIPKQVTTFRAKYNQATGLVTFTGNNSGGKIEYRKNNTEEWLDFDALSTDEVKATLLRLCEKGASVYFRIAAENGSSASSAGKRPGKAVTCKISQKSSAPDVTIDTATSKITVESGWQVRKVEVDETTGTQYVTEKKPINDDEDVKNKVDSENWYQYEAEEDVDVFETLAREAKYGANDQHDVYLQFRKAATSSSQVSYITTIKVPKQEAEPAVNVNVEYTSTTTFNLSFPEASSSQPYEYCVVTKEDIKDGKIVDVDSVTWTTVSSSASTEVKKADAPEGGYIYFRKKSVGKIGDDDFKLASAYVRYENQIDYPETGSTGCGTVNKEVDIFDGVCTTNNSSGHIDFQITTPYNTTISTVQLSATPDQTGGEGSATVTSTVKKNTNPSADKSDAYIISATITNISLSEAQKETLDDLDGESTLDLYAYILLKSNSTEKLEITSNEDSGLRIHMAKKSAIDTDLTTDTANAVSVTRLIGATSKSDSQQYETFWFNLELGLSEGTDISDYFGVTSTDDDPTLMEIESVTLGNYELARNTDYTYDVESNKFTVNLSKFETDTKLYSSYGTTKQLVIKLNSNEKLTGVTITLVPPVSLNSTYSWAFTKGGLETETTVTTSNGSTTTTKEEKVNSYSVAYQKTSKKVNDVGIESVDLTSVTCSKDATGDAINILYNQDDNKITFDNSLLNTLPKLTSEPVVFTFKVTYTTGTVLYYTINQGCYFTVM